MTAGKAPGENQADTRAVTGTQGTLASPYAIGTDIDLLCAAVRVVARRRAAATTGSVTIQRKVRVGFVKAQRLVILLERHGVIGTELGGGRHMVLVTEEQVPEVTARLRKIASEETAPCKQCGAPGVVHHVPGDRPDFWLCLSCDD